MPIMVKPGHETGTSITIDDVYSDDPAVQDWIDRQAQHLGPYLRRIEHIKGLIRREILKPRPSVGRLNRYHAMLDEIDWEMPRDDAPGAPDVLETWTSDVVRLHR